MTSKVGGRRLSRNHLVSTMSTKTPENAGLVRDGLRRARLPGLSLVALEGSCHCDISSTAEKSEA